MRNNGENFVLGAGQGLGGFPRGLLADEQLFAFGLRLLALGNIHIGSDEAQRLALLVVEDAALRANPPHLAGVSAHNPILRLPPLKLLFQNFPQAGLAGGTVFREYTLEPSLIRVARAIRRQAEESFQLLCPDRLISANVPIEC